mgnify:CR=1 FL=1
MIRIPIGLDLTAIILGALAGGLAARRHDFDLAGALFLAVSCGVGGGVARDLVLGDGPPVALREPWLLPAALAGGACIHFGGHLLDLAPAVIARRADAAYVWLDSGSLALYGIIGTAKAEAFHLPAVSCVAVGVLAATGGAIIRDVVVNERPQVFLPGHLYAVAAATGCTLFLLLQEATRRPNLSAVVGGALIVAVRVVSYLRNWSTAPARRHGPRTPTGRDNPTP